MTSYRGEDVYAEALAKIERLRGYEMDDRALAAAACATLVATIPPYGWAGIFRVEDERLSLWAASDGHSDESLSERSPSRAAIAAISQRAPVIVDDLRDTPAGGAIGWAVLAELAAPIVRDGQVVAVLDILSEHRNPFGIADDEFLALLLQLIPLPQ